MTNEHQHSSHPNVHQAFSPWSENQKLYLATMYSNPLRWNTRRELFHDFRKRCDANPNVVLYVGEIAYGNRPHEVTCPDNPRDIQFRSGDELWHKENCLNLVTQRFPEEAQYLGYLDGDIIMSRYDWALEAIHLLQHYQAVQLFSQFTDMDKRHKPLGVTNGFAYEYGNSIIPAMYQAPDAKPNPTKGKGSYQEMLGKAAIKKRVWWGATGLGWAFRKSAWQAMGGLLDTCILGSADWHMAYGMAGLSSGTHGDFQASDPYTQSILTWQEHAKGLESNIWYVDNHVTHYWHGSKETRFYRDRTQILIENEFHPGRDIKRDHQGLWQLAGNKPRLRDDLRAYFRARNEDALS